MKIILISIALVAIPIIVSFIRRHRNPLSISNLKKYEKCTDETVLRHLKEVYQRQLYCHAWDFDPYLTEADFPNYEIRIIKKESQFFKNIQTVILEAQYFEEVWFVKTADGLILILLHSEEVKLRESLLYMSPKSSENKSALGITASTITLELMWYTGDRIETLV